MRFKLVGLLMLLAGMAMVGYALVIDRGLRDPTFKPQTYCLAAIFLVLTTRVLQAERHHRSPRNRRISDVEPIRPVERARETDYSEDLDRPSYVDRR